MNQQLYQREMASTTPNSGGQGPRDREKEALRKLLHAKIACENSVDDLQTLDGLTDDWDQEDGILENATLEIHLQCESSCKESSTLHDLLTGLLNGTNTPSWLWTEIELRQENAVAAAKEIIKVVDKLPSSNMNPLLGLKEIKRRAELVTAKLEALKQTFSELEEEVQAIVAESQSGK